MKKELRTIQDDPEIVYCYIRKYGSYYRSNSSGYTDYIEEAGVYLKEKAISAAVHCNDLRIVPINIAEHNKMLLEKIEGLKTKLIH